MTKVKLKTGTYTADKDGKAFIYQVGDIFEVSQSVADTFASCFEIIADTPEAAESEPAENSDKDTEKKPLTASVKEPVKPSKSAKVVTAAKTLLAGSKKKS